MSTTWRVRPEGAHTATELPSADAVVAGLRDGVLAPSDEVKGPADRDWMAIEAHPRFEEVCADLEGPAQEHPDETHLDMNPLIDVCLVLLIFFILTITYESLRRSIDIPQDAREEKGAPTQLDINDVKDKVFRVKASMNAEKVVIMVEDRTIPQNLIQDEFEKVMRNTGRREMLLDIDGQVPWGTQTAILDAAKGAKVQNIIYRPRR